jgi:tetratricopeptide (TPR) repeat protein
MIVRIVFFLFVIEALSAGPVRADGSPLEEAGKHFERGVSMYDEADYRAALVEFRRAYEIAPNALVLYNIGETYYQLQNYAAALTALDRYLAESGETAEHRVEVGKTIDILRSRVGKVEITTNVPGCEITVDDEFVGKTPFAEPVSISIGRRKITAMRAGLPPDTRFVEVAAGDTVKTSLTLVEATDRAADATPTLADEAGRRSTFITASWITTGALAAGGLTFGVLAFSAWHDLKDARGEFGVSHDDLTQKASRVKLVSAIGDGLGIAAIIAGAVSLKLTLSQSHTHEVHASLGPTGIVVGGSFR